MQDTDYPGLYQSANDIAKYHQKWHYRCLNASLWVLVIGACLAFFPADLSGDNTAAIIAAILFACTIGLTLLMANKRFDAAWYTGREIAESIKAHRYMMRTEPYNSLDDKAREQFPQELHKIINHSSDAGRVIPASSTPPITDEMKRVRALPIAEKRDYYKTNRLANQRDWYIKQATSNKRKNNLWFCLLVACQICALICVVLKISFRQFPLPAGFFTTLAGATLSWAQAKKYGELATAYNAIALKISLIDFPESDMPAEDQLASSIRETENAFAAEHTQWIIRRKN